MTFSCSIKFKALISFLSRVFSTSVLIDLRSITLMAAYSSVWMFLPVMDHWKYLEKQWRRSLFRSDGLENTWSFWFACSLSCQLSVILNVYRVFTFFSLMTVLFELPSCPIEPMQIISDNTPAFPSSSLFFSTLYFCQSVQSTHRVVSLSFIHWMLPLFRSLSECSP